MQTVSYRAFVTQKRFRRLVAGGAELLVTQHGKPFFRALPPERPASHKGAGRHLSNGKPVSPAPVDVDWGGLA